MQRVLSIFLIIFLIPILIASCDSASTGDGNGGGEVMFALEDAFPGVTFERPVDLQNARDGTERLFVVEQRGVIIVVTPQTVSVNNSAPAGKGTRLVDVNEFLDIRDRVLFDEGERGLLGLAFHPDFESNGFFYVYYNADSPNRTVISRFIVREGDQSSADPDSELILLEFNQPSVNHKGGQLAFGPEDGFLYIAVGDGGASGTAQDLTSLLGSILRIDIDNPDGGKNYGIPPGNPFSGNVSGFREEIFAYGFRNPWRFGFDESNGALFVGDVGQDRREEIDLVENGKNYGWDVMEGSLCFDPPAGCDTSGLELPILEYGRDEGGTIIAGLVYRGGGISELFGKFIYGDFLSGTIWALGHNGTIVTENSEIAHADEFTLTAFGSDEEGEIYACSLDGIIYRLIKE